MSCNISYISPSCIEETGTIWNKKQLPVKESCESKTSNTLDDLWCNEVCGNDVNYFIPVSQGDKLTIQTRFFDNLNFGNLTTFGQDCDDLEFGRLRMEWEVVDSGHTWGGSNNTIGATYDFIWQYPNCSRTNSTTVPQLIDCSMTPSTDLSDYMQNKFVPFYNGFFAGEVTVSWQNGTNPNSGRLIFDFDMDAYGRRLSGYLACINNSGDICECFEQTIFNLSNGLNYCGDPWAEICFYNHNGCGGSGNNFTQSVNQFVSANFVGATCCCAEVEPECKGISSGGCSQDEEFATFAIQIPDNPALVYGTNNQDTAQVADSGFIIILDGSNCSSFSYDDVPILQTLGAATDYNNFLTNVENELTFFWSGVGSSTVSRTGSEFLINIDKSAYESIFGTNVCEDSFNVCVYNENKTSVVNGQNGCQTDAEFFKFSLTFPHLNDNQNANTTIDITNDCGLNISHTLNQVYQTGNNTEILENIRLGIQSQLLGNSKSYLSKSELYTVRDFSPVQPNLRPDLEPDTINFEVDLSQNPEFCCRGSNLVVNLSNQSPSFQTLNPVSENDYSFYPYFQVFDIQTCCETVCYNENGFVSYEFNLSEYATFKFQPVSIEFKIYWQTGTPLTFPFVPNANDVITYDLDAVFSNYDRLDIPNSFPDYFTVLAFAYNADKSNWINPGTMGPEGYITYDGDLNLLMHIPILAIQNLGFDCDEFQPYINIKHILGL